MKTASTTLKNHLRTASTVEVTPRLLAEWNFNRYYTTTADNTPSEDDAGNDIEVFPIDSIIKPNRPTAGIAKALVGEAYVSPNYVDGLPTRRYYLGGPDDPYKYWASPTISSATAPYDMPLHTDGITNVRPRVEYWEENGTTPKAVTCNKIHIGLENSFASPDNWDIEYKNAAGAWVKISTTPVIASDGTVDLWWNGTAWTTTRSYTSTTTIYGIRLVVRSMNKGNTYFNLIEISARLERDLTADLIDSSDDYNLGEPDFITPLGTLSSNTGSVRLFNDHENYSSENEEGPYFGLLDKNVKMSLYYDYVLPGGVIETVQQFSMLTDTWTESEEDAEVSVELLDSSTILMDIKPPPVMYLNVSVQEAVWRVCDLVGFSDYILTIPENEPNSMIEIFWTTGEQTVWEVFQELSRGTQTAIYFDGAGKLNIKTRKAAFDTSKAVSWTARETPNGTEQPDIVSLDVETAYEANKVIINYTPTDFAEVKEGFQTMTVVWEPEGTLALRANDLQKSIDLDDPYIWLSTQDVKSWPFEGIVDIEGELIRYSGKSYSYYDGSVKKTETVKSLAEAKKLAEKTPDIRKHLNAYNGALVISERGLWNTEPAEHNIDVKGWTERAIFNNENGKSNSPTHTIKHNKKDSTVGIKNSSKYGANDYSYFYRGNATDVGYWYLGTKMKIDKGAYKNQTAGFFFNSDELGGGYFIEVTPTADLNGVDRKHRNEIVFYSKQAGGATKNFGGEEDRVKDKGRGDNKGAKKTVSLGVTEPVLEGKWFELDVVFEVLGNGDHRITVDFNGAPSLTAVVPQGSGWQHGRVSRFGFFARGKSSATYEYAYGITNMDVLRIDGEQFLDRAEDSFYGQQWIRDWTYETRRARRRVKKKWKKYNQKYRQRFFDDFGPMVHEVREMDVKFDVEAPVLQSRLFMTNDTQAVCPEYQSNPFGAKFILANASRNTAVLNGEDNLTAPGSTINQRCLVFGRAVTQGEEAKVEKKDEWAIKRRGEIEIEFSNKWIQNKDEADRLGDWIVGQWARNNTKFTVEIFGNPLIELTDVVDIQFGDLVAGTDKFFVTGISSSFDAGIKTTLELRRV